MPQPHPTPGWLGDTGIPSQFTPAIRPFLQTLSIGLVSFGEHYKRNETGLSEWQLDPAHTLSCPPFPNPTEQSGYHQGSLTPSPCSPGVTASSLFTGGRFAIDPELRGAEFERIIQNLDVHFWKAFWNITEIEVLSVSRLRRRPLLAYSQTSSKATTARHRAPGARIPHKNKRLGWEEEACGMVCAPQPP